jgi:glycosyltransferase involved in cell wall biosynthesis
MSHYVLDARTATAHFPGIGRYVRNLATAMVPLLSADEELTILWNPTDPTAWNPSPLASPQVNAFPAPVSPFSPSQQWTIPRLLRQIVRRPSSVVGRRSSVVRRPLYHSTYYLMPYRPGVPAIMTLYDLIALIHPRTVSPRARLLFRFTTWLALRSVRQVITISDATRQDLLQHFSIAAERVTTIPLAADPRFQPQPQSAIEAVRQKYNLPERYLFYLGINKPHKNLVRLVEAMSQLGPRPLPLVIAGAWDERYPEPKARAETLGLADQVRFLGPVDDADLPALYSGCTLFVFPSLYEGFGLPVLEAMACGAPVACSNASSLPEVTADAALLFDPLDVKAIAAVLHRGVEDADLRRSLAEQGVRQAANFSWVRTAAETLALYQKRSSVR